MTTDLNPWRVGAALSVTIAAGYTICTTLFYAWPDAAMQFMNTLFHGLDFGKLAPAASWSLTAFICAVVIFAIWGFLMGALFACLFNRLRRRAGYG